MDNKERLIEVMKKAVATQCNGDQFYVIVADAIAAANLLAPQWMSVKDIPLQLGWRVVLSRDLIDHRDEYFEVVTEETLRWLKMNDVTHYFHVPAAPEDNHDDTRTTEEV